MVQLNPEERATFEDVQEMFYKLRQERATQNDQTWLSADGDIVAALMAKVADLANDCEMMFIHLVLLWSDLHSDEEDENPNIGLKSFTRSKDEWRKSNSREQAQDG